MIAERILIKILFYMPINDWFESLILVDQKWKMIINYVCSSCLYGFICHQGSHFRAKFKVSFGSRIYNIRNVKLAKHLIMLGGSKLKKFSIFMEPSYPSLQKYNCQLFISLLSNCLNLTTLRLYGKLSLFESEFQFIPPLLCLNQLYVTNNESNFLLKLYFILLRIMSHSTNLKWLTLVSFSPNYAEQKGWHYIVDRRFKSEQECLHDLMRELESRCRLWHSFDADMFKIGQIDMPQHLTDINLFMCYNHKKCNEIDTCWAYDCLKLLSSCPALESINLDGTCDSSFYCNHALDDHFSTLLIAELSKLNNFKSIDLKYFKLNWNVYEDFVVPNSMLLWLKAPFFKRLTNFDVCLSSGYNYRTLIRLYESMFNLTTIYIPIDYGYENVIKSLISSCPNLNDIMIWDESKGFLLCELLDFVHGMVHHGCTRCACCSKSQQVVSRNVPFIDITFHADDLHEANIRCLCGMSIRLWSGGYIFRINCH